MLALVLTVAVSSDGWGNVNRRPLLNVTIQDCATNTMLVRALDVSGNYKSKEWMADWLVEQVKGLPPKLGRPVWCGDR